MMLIARGCHLGQRREGAGVCSEEIRQKTATNTRFSRLHRVLRAPKLLIMGRSDLSDREGHIKNELMGLFNEQTEFFRKGGQAKHTRTEIEEYEKRRERIRRLFAELEELRKGPEVGFP